MYQSHVWRIIHLKEKFYKHYTISFMLTDKICAVDAAAPFAPLVDGEEAAPTSAHLVPPVPGVPEVAICVNDDVSVSDATTWLPGAPPQPPPPQPPPQPTQPPLLPSPPSPPSCPLLPEVSIVPIPSRVCA